jgi:hypothetical protein
LKDGDEVSIKSVFLDTRSTNTNGATGRISIDESNNKWDMNHLMYLTNYKAYGTDFVFQDNSANAQALDHPDGYTYVCGFDATAAQTQNTLRLTSLTIKGGAPPRKRDRLSGNIIYTTASGIQGQKYPIVFPATDRHAKDVEVRKDDGTDDGAPLDMLFQGTAGQTGFVESDIVFDDPVRIGDHGISLEPDAGGSGDVGPPYTNLAGTAVVVENNDKILPYIVNTQFDIPNGDYEPDALAKYITDRLTAQAWTGSSTNIDMKTTIPSFTPLVDPGESIYVSTHATLNPFFTSIKQMQTAREYGFFPNQAKINFVRRDNESILEIDRNCVDDYIIGTNELSLIFDNTLNKFVFQQMHAPIMGSATNPNPGAGDPLNEGIQFSQVGATGDFFSAQSNSGIMWYSFGATNGTKTQNLLYSSMGFDSSIFCAVAQASPRTYGHPASINNTIAFTSPNNVGTNQTGHLDSIDDFFKKDINFFKSFALADAFIETINLSSIIGQKTRGPTGDGELSNGYFLVEVGGLPHQGISYSNSALNKNKNTSIKSIVGRFYATSDYTEDAGQGSIPYIYKGVPQYLTSLRVRICDPNGNPTTSIGQDNCVFLQVISQTPSIQPQS